MFIAPLIRSSVSTVGFLLSSPVMKYLLYYSFLIFQLASCVMNVGQVSEAENRTSVVHDSISTSGMSYSFLGNENEVLRHGGDHDKDIAKQADYKPKDVNAVYEVWETDRIPLFPGGQDGLMKYLSDNVKYPKVAEDRGIQGRVILQFVIDKKGKTTDIKVVTSVDPELDAEAVRAVKAMPRWEPGLVGDKKVKVKYILPLAFKLK